MEQVRCHGNCPTELDGKAAPLARRRLGEQRTPLERQLTEEYGRARLHGARASCRGALSHPTECSNASGWLTAPRLEVLVSRPVAGAGSSIRQLKIGLASARCCSAEEHTTPCTHGAPYGHVLAAPGGARRPPEPNTTIGLCRRGRQVRSTTGCVCVCACVCGVCAHAQGRAHTCACGPKTGQSRTRESLWAAVAVTASRERTVRWLEKSSSYPRAR